MKKNFSVILFLFRERIERLFILLGILWGASFGGFYALGCMKGDDFGDVSGSFFLGAVFMITFLGLTLHMSMVGNKKSHPAYIIWRLKISEKKYYLFECLVNTLCYILLYLMEILVVVCLAAIFSKNTICEQGPQGIMMSYYRYRFLHAILPLKETGLLIRNFFLLLCMGIASAEEAVQLRHGKNAYLSLVAVQAFVFSQFPKGLDEEIFLMADVFLPILLLVCLWSGLYNAYGDFGEAAKADEEDEDTETAKSHVAHVYEEADKPAKEDGNGQTE